MPIGPLKYWFKGLPLPGLDANTALKYWFKGLPLPGLDANIAQFTYTGAGGLAFAGSVTVARTYAGQGAGGITLAGAAGLARSYVPPTAGGIAFSGAATSTQIFPYDGSGGLTLAGAATATTVSAYSGTGGLALSGVADAFLSRLYTYAASGGIAFAGAAAANQSVFAYLGSGGLAFAGTAGLGSAFDYTAAGGLAFSGTANAALGHAYSPDGGLTFAGTAGLALTFRRIGAGGIQLSGAAATHGPFLFVGSGGIVFAGSAKAIPFQYKASGGISFSGAAKESQTHTYRPSGGLVFAGAASAVEQTGAPVPQQLTIVPTVTDGGSGYATPPTVTITGSDSLSHGVTAIAVLNASGAVTDVIVTNTGDGTISGPLAVAITGGGGSGATATAKLVSPQSVLAAQPFPFQVKAGGDSGYGFLTLETVLDDVVGDTATLLPPPLPQPTLDPRDAARAVDPANSLQLADVRTARPWAAWYQSLWDFVRGADPTRVAILAPSVDETDSEWYITGALPDTSTDPATFTAHLVGNSRHGMQVEILNGGSGYTNATVATISGANGSGRGASAVVTVALGQVVAVTVTGGYGYQAPLSIIFSDTGGGSGALAKVQPGRMWNVGDYGIWLNPAIIGGDQTAIASFSFEIDLITDIIPIDDTHATITVRRRAQGAALTEAQYGSPIAVQPAGSQFYRLINQDFEVLHRKGNGPQLHLLPWPNMTVAAARVSSSSLAPAVLNLAPAPYLPGTKTRDPRTTPACPGLRTMNGAAYTNLGLFGTLAPSLTAIARVPVQAPESLRTIYGVLRIAPTGPVPFQGDANATVVVYAVYIAPPDAIGNRAVGLVDTLIWYPGEFTSYRPANSLFGNADVPHGRQMPYHKYFPLAGTNADWPPNRLPLLTGALDGSGNLQLGFTIDPTQSVIFRPDGEMDLIVQQAGATVPGQDLQVVYQT